MNEDKKAKLLAIAKKRLDVPNMIFDIIDEILEPALDKLVKDTATPFDDIAKAAIYPVLRSEIQKQIEELWLKL